MSNVKMYGGDGQDPETRSKDINSIPLTDFKSQLYISLILSLQHKEPLLTAIFWLRVYAKDILGY